MDYPLSYHKYKEFPPLDELEIEFVLINVS